MREPPGAPRTFHHVLALHPRGRLVTAMGVALPLAFGAIAAWMVPGMVALPSRLNQDGALGDQFARWGGAIVLVMTPVMAAMAALMAVRAARVVLARQRVFEVGATGLVQRDGSRIVRRLPWSQVRSLRHHPRFPFATTVVGTNGRMSFDACWRAPDETEFALVLFPASGLGQASVPLPHLTLDASELLRRVADSSRHEPIAMPERTWLAEVAAGQPVGALARLDVPAPDWRTHLARAAAWRCLGNERAVRAELAALHSGAAHAPLAVRDGALDLADHLATGRGPADLDGQSSWLRREHRLRDAMLRCGGEAEVSPGAPSPN